jgi:hypothetical protein
MRSSIMALAALLLSATSATAQLPYDRTVFIHGLGDYYRWTGQNTPGQISSSIDLGGILTPYSVDAQQTVDVQARGYKSNTLQFFGGTHVLVGHSMGGVIARDLLTSPDGSINIGSQVAGIVTVASPNFGAPIAENAGKFDIHGRPLLEGFFYELSTTILLPGYGLLSAALNSLLNWMAETVITNGIKQLIANLAGATSVGARDLKPSSATIARLSTTLDSKPHVTVNGSIPKKDAVFYVWSGMNWGDGRSAVRNKDILRTGIRVCTTLLYNFILKTSTGRVCHIIDRTLGGLDDRWNEWTHGPNRSTPFDGFLPQDYTRYPGTSASSSINLSIGGANHFTIAFHTQGIEGIKSGMRNIGMRQVGGTTGGGDGGGGGGGGGGGCEDPNTCLQMMRTPAPSVDSTRANGRTLYQRAPARPAVSRPKAGG